MGYPEPETVSITIDELKVTPPSVDRKLVMCAVGWFSIITMTELPLANTAGQ